MVYLKLKTEYSNITRCSRNPLECYPLNHSIVSPDRNQHHQEHDQIAQRQPPIVGHRPRQKDLCQPMNLVRHAHENERRNNDVQVGEAGQQHQHTVPIGGQPNVILANEQLQRDPTEPGKKRRETCPQNTRDIAQHQIADDRYEHDVRMDLFAVIAIRAHKCERCVEADAQNGGQSCHERCASIE